MTNLTPENLARLAERDDCVVMQPTHDTIFEPWPASRVRQCVERIVAIAKTCASEDDARTKIQASSAAEECAEFAEKYQLMYQRLTTPAIARNQGHVDIILGMVDLRDSIDRGAVTEQEAQRVVSETAIANLMQQARGAQ